jgi:hypothetical protein
MSQAFMAGGLITATHNTESIITRKTGQAYIHPTRQKKLRN